MPHVNSRKLDRTCDAFENSKHITISTVLIEKEAILINIYIPNNGLSKFHGLCSPWGPKSV